MCVCVCMIRGGRETPRGASYPCESSSLRCSMVCRVSRRSRANVDADGGHRACTAQTTASSLVSLILCSRTLRFACVRGESSFGSTVEPPGVLGILEMPGALECMLEASLRLSELRSDESFVHLFYFQKDDGPSASSSSVALPWRRSKLI